MPASAAPSSVRPPARSGREQGMVKFEVARPITMEEVAALLPMAVPPTATVQPKRDGWLVVHGHARVRIKGKPRHGGTRISVAADYPWWVWLFFLLGLVAIIIAMVVYDST